MLTKLKLSGPLVSIVVPIYNAEEYLEECLNSLKNQTLKNIEIILVNDCSTDRSADIIYSYIASDKRFKTVTHPANKGLILARQSGVKVATADYVGHVDADDYVQEDMFETLYELIVETGADIAQCGMKKVSDDGARIVKRSMAAPETLFGEEIYQHFLDGKVGFSVCNKLYSKSLWLKCQSSFPRRRCSSEDLAQNAIMLYYAQKLVSTTRAFYAYRTVENSDSTSNDLASLCHRVYWAARQVAKVKQLLKSQNDLEKHDFRLFNFEKGIYNEYMKFFFNYVSNTPLSAQDWKVVDRTIVNIYRLNGYIPLAKFVPTNSRLFLPIRKLISKDYSCDVSIIIPVFNTEEYLKRALDSIVCSRNIKLEIIVVDDCSTDSSLKLVEEYKKKDQRIKIVRHDENKGLLQARLTGVRATTGRYICFLDSDDFLDKNYINGLYGAVEHYAADVTICGYREFSDEKEEIRCKTVEHISFYEGEDILTAFLNTEISWSMWNKMYSSYLWRLTLPYLPDITYKAEDFLQNMYLLHFASTAVFIPDILYNYYIREGSGDRTKDVKTVANRATAAAHHMQTLRKIVHHKEPSDLLLKAYYGRIDNYFYNMNDAFQRIDWHQKIVDTAMIDIIKRMGWQYYRQQFLDRFLSSNKVPFTNRTNGPLVGRPFIRNTEPRNRLNGEKSFRSLFKQKADYRGSVTSTKGNIISGWAWNKADEHENCIIYVELNGLVIVSDVANILNGRLDNTTKGLARHAFRISISDYDLKEGDILSVKMQGGKLLRNGSLKYYKNGLRQTV